VNKRSKKLLSAVGILCLTSTLGTLCFLCAVGNESTPTRPDSVAISFLSYSNDAHGQKWALIVLTNQNRWNVSWGHVEIELNNPRAKHPTPNWNLPPEIKKRYAGNPDSNYEAARVIGETTIKPGASELVALQIADPDARWNAEWIFQRENWLDRLYEKTPNSILRLFNWSHDFEAFRISSQWVEP